MIVLLKNPILLSLSKFEKLLNKSRVSPKREIPVQFRFFVVSFSRMTWSKVCTKYTSDQAII